MLKLITNKSPDILDCIANLSNDEVFTSPKLANDILDLLPPEVWKNKELTFLDPASKTGVFLREIAKRLLAGLADEIPDEEARRKHIFQNMVFGVAITELTGILSRRTLYYTKDATKDESVVKLEKADGNIIYQSTNHSFKGDSCSICGASKEAYSRGASTENHAYSFIHENIETLFKEHFTAKGKPMKFDVIVGNPPYQLKDDGHGASASPLYHLFIEQAKKLNPKYISFIVPSRWFAGGKGLDSFRADMLADARIKKLTDYVNAKECFPGISLSGGVSYFLWDRDYSGECEVINILNGHSTFSKRALNEFSVFIRYNAAISIINQIKSFGESSISDMVSSRNPYGISSNVRGEPVQTGNLLRLYSSGGAGYVPISMVTKGLASIPKFKVLISKVTSEHAGEPDKNGQFKLLSSLRVIGANEICTDSYLVVGEFTELLEASNFCQYLKSKFVRFLLLQAVSSINLSKEKFVFVPVQDWQAPKELFTDEALYKKYKLSKQDIEVIDSIVKEMP